LFALAGLLLCACGPQLGDLEKGEESRVVRAYSGDTLELESGLRVFLAEIDAPRGEQAYAAQAQGELEALAVNRPVRLAYGGAKRWTPRPRTAPNGEALPPPSETAIAHVFVQSEGGRWFWLQHELVSRGAAYVRPRRDNHARTEELLALEAQARATERGLWQGRDYAAMTARAAAAAALAANDSCLRGAAPYRLVEARVADAEVFARRASLTLDGAPAETPFSIVVFGDSFADWDGPPLEEFEGPRIRARGSLGVFHEQPQLCIDHSSQIEIVAE
jgi:endonuclease YncB( thermonuclease family)